MRIFELNKQNIMYHVSKSKNRNSVLSHGLEARNQEYLNITRNPGVYMFKFLNDATDWAFWGAISDHEQYDIFEILLPDNYQIEPDLHPEMSDIYDAWIGREIISPENIKLIKTQKIPKSSEEAPPFSTTKTKLRKNIDESTKPPHQTVINAVNSTKLPYKEIWFHGSRAREDNNRRSDWDYLVIVPDKYKDQYLKYALTLPKLDITGNKSIDIQPALEKNFNRKGSVAWWAKEEGYKIT